MYSVCVKSKRSNFTFTNDDVTVALTVTLPTAQDKRRTTLFHYYCDREIVLNAIQCCARDSGVLENR